MIYTMCVREDNGVNSSKENMLTRGEGWVSDIRCSSYSNNTVSCSHHYLQGPLCLPRSEKVLNLLLHFLGLKKALKSLNY